MYQSTPQVRSFKFSLQGSQKSGFLLAASWVFVGFEKLAENWSTLFVYQVATIDADIERLSASLPLCLAREADSTGFLPDGRGKPV